MRIPEVIVGSEVKIYTMSGELVRVEQIHGQSQQISRGNLGRGMYIYHVEVNGMIKARGNLVITGL